MRHAVHDIVIRTRDGATTNAEGVSTMSWRKQFVRGNVSPLNAQEQQVAAQRGVSAAVVAEVPKRALVDSSAEIDVSGTRELGLDGSYQVTEVRPNQAVQRLLCIRYQVPEVEQAAI